MHKILLAVMAALLVSATCETGPPTPPGPPQDAGLDVAPDAIPTTPYERCRAEKRADPVTQNVSVQAGTPLEVLVARVCSDRIVQESYR